MILLAASRPAVIAFLLAAFWSYYGDSLHWRN
jgi:hypothetical protein